VDATDRAARAAQQLEGTRFADVRWVTETGSTNADVLELARHGEAEGIVVAADHQTAGRGRLGRTWEAPAEGSLLCTILLRPPAAVAAATTMAVAVAAADAVTELTGFTPRLKWPNDLVWPGDGSVTDRKLAGILAEVDWPAGSNIASGWAEPKPGDRLVVAVGIGINVAWGRTVPDDLADIAVALDHLTSPAAPPDRVELLVAMLRHLDRRYGALLASPAGAAELRDGWRERSATLGRLVRVDLGAEDVEGAAVDITEEGHLVIDTVDGRRTLAVGDVVHLRPR
jgi:BirA family transcriptional regulator, biotin operon repressor / biotin---[acetyl-CoA-carboxylase] ligase